MNVPSHGRNPAIAHAVCDVQVCVCVCVSVCLHVALLLLLLRYVSAAKVHSRITVVRITRANCDAMSVVDILFTTLCVLYVK